eukprot:2650829-Prymnesium_polylepis.1
MAIAISCIAASSRETLCSAPAPSTMRLSWTAICGAELASRFRQRLQPEQKRSPRISHGRDRARSNHARAALRCAGVSAHSSLSDSRRSRRSSEPTRRS